MTDGVGFQTGNLLPWDLDPHSFPLKNNVKAHILGTEKHRRTDSHEKTSSREMGSLYWLSLICWERGLLLSLREVDVVL